VLVCTFELSKETSKTIKNSDIITNTYKNKSEKSEKSKSVITHNIENEEELNNNILNDDTKQRRGRAMRLKEKVQNSRNNVRQSSEKINRIKRWGDDNDFDHNYNKRKVIQNSGYKNEFLKTLKSNEPIKEEINENTSLSKASRNLP